MVRKKDVSWTGLVANGTAAGDSDCDGGSAGNRAWVGHGAAAGNDVGAVKGAGAGSSVEQAVRATKATRIMQKLDLSFIE
jgi:hypothetical protein